jgi:hypothetical protein
MPNIQWEPIQELSLMLDVVFPILVDVFPILVDTYLTDLEGLC